MNVGSLYSNCGYVECACGTLAKMCSRFSTMHGFLTHNLYLHGGNGCLKYWVLILLVLFFRKVYINMPNNAHSLAGFK